MLFSKNRRNAEQKKCSTEELQSTSITHPCNAPPLQVQLVTRSTPFPNVSHTCSCVHGRFIPSLQYALLLTLATTALPLMVNLFQQNTLPPNSTHDYLSLHPLAMPHTADLTSVHLPSWHSL
eukprot:1161864-Pelagomonas_calceolata.AAC.20